MIKTGCFALADFICPTPQTRQAFTEGGPALVVWVDRIEKSAFEDTNRMFVPPETWDVHVKAEGSAEYWAEQVAHKVRPIFDPKQPAALFMVAISRFTMGTKR